MEPSVFPPSAPPEASSLPPGASLSVLSESPLIYTIDGFLCGEEIARFLDLARGRLRCARVVAGSGSELDAARVKSDGRTNSSCWVPGYDPLLAGVEQRICGMLGVPERNSERFQVIHYDKGQLYAPHLDTHAVTTDETPGGQRTATVLLYLNDVEQGGATEFVNLGLSVEPRAGRLLCFHNCLPGTNAPDSRLLHTGTAVARGEKWAVNKWVRERCIRLNYEQESDPSSVHLGMSRAEVLELIAEMELEDMLGVIEDEAVALPPGPGADAQRRGEADAVAAAVTELGADRCRAMLRQHFGIDCD
jgi:hypothetical protein